MKTDISEIKDLYPFKSHYHLIKGHKYHYVDEGKGKGKVMVMVHGNPTWSFFYRNLIKEMSKNYRVIAPDHLGCGLSDKPKDFEYRLETHIENLESLIVSLKVDCITLVMHDWGGAIGMGFAVRHPHRIKSLVVMNSAAFSMDSIPWRIALGRIPWLGDFLVRKLNLFCRSAIRMAVRKKLPPDVVKGYLLPYNNYENRIGVLRFIQDIPLSVNDISYEVLLEIEHGLWMFREVPVCLLWGMKDWCFNTQFLRKWRTYYPQAEVHPLDNVGHYVLEDGCDQVVEHLRNFCQKNNI